MGTSLLTRLERFYDAVPRGAAGTEEHGPLTLFVSEGVPWPYYARPRLGLTDEVRAADVERVRARQRELGVTEAFEWVHDTTPSLLAAARASGLHVLEAPLMVLDRSAWAPAPPPPDIRLRLLAPDDPDLASAQAVAMLAFGAPGTATGAGGPEARDQAAAGHTEPELAPLRERLRRALTVTAIATGDDGPLAVGSHQPVDDVTEIVGIGTLPAARRRGLGVAVTARLLEDAEERSVDLIFLSAGSDAVARIYGRVGFRRVGTACIAEPAP